MYIENACNKVTVEQRTRLFAAVLFFCVNLREKMFDIPACVIHLQYVPNGYFYFSLKMEGWSWHSSASRQVPLQVLVNSFNTDDAINTAEVKLKNNLSDTETPFLNSS